MSLRRLVFQFVLAMGALCAQPSATPEVRGTVLEQGPNTGLAGAEVVLTEFVPRDKDLDPRVFATVFTDEHGAFSFKPGHLGDFRLDVKKAGYVNVEGFTGDARGTNLILTSQAPSREFAFRLMLPASLTGRVVNEDGHPVANFPVTIIQTPGIGRDSRSTTDQDGVFIAPDLPPGRYLVRVAPKSGALESAMDFTEEEFKIVDRDFEVSYWPGEAPDVRSALPMMVAPGATASIGTITLRKTNYYRVHVSISGDCAPGEKWSYAVFNVADSGASARFNLIPCAKELLFRNFRPGSRTFAIWNQKQSDQLRWASAPIEVATENVHVELTLSSGTDVTGRLILPDGAALTSLGNARVSFQPEPSYLTLHEYALYQKPDGTFLVPSLPWARYRVGMLRLPSSYYIKEIRYDKVPLPDGILTLSPGASLELVLDDHPTTVIGTVLSGDKPVSGAEVFLAKWPSRSGSSERSASSVMSQTNRDGQFQFGGLAPGEYRIAAFSRESLIQLSGSVNVTNLTTRGGEKITLERGGQQNIQLKLIDPSR